MLEMNEERLGEWLRFWREVYHNHGHTRDVCQYCVGVGHQFINCPHVIFIFENNKKWRDQEKAKGARKGQKSRKNKVKPRKRLRKGTIKLISSIGFVIGLVLVFLAIFRIKVTLEAVVITAMIVGGLLLFIEAEWVVEMAKDHSLIHIKDLDEVEDEDE